MEKTVDSIVSGAAPYEHVGEEEANQGYLSDVPSLWSELKTQAQESVVGRHLPGFSEDTVSNFEQSWDSEKHRKLAVDLGAYLDDAALPARSGQPLLSPEEANARYGFEGPDGKQIKVASEPVPDEVAREQGDRAKEKMRRQSIMTRWNDAHSWDTPIGQIPTPYGFATQLLTPDTAAMALIPDVGEEYLLAKLGTGLIPRTAAKAISGATTFAAGSGAMMAADTMLPDWRGERADLSLREAMNELYSSAAMGTIMHAAVNPAIGAAWRQAQRIALQRAGKAVEAPEAPPVPGIAPEAPASGAASPLAAEKPIGGIEEALAAEAPKPAAPTPAASEEPAPAPSQPPVAEAPRPAPVERAEEKVTTEAPAKPIGDIAEALTQIESSDGPTKRKAMDTATGQVLEGKPVEVRPHFDHGTAEEVIQEQARQDRDGYAPGIPAATLAEETAKVYTPPKPDPEKFEKEMGGPVVVPEPIAQRPAIPVSETLEQAGRPEAAVSATQHIQALKAAALSDQAFQQALDALRAANPTKAQLREIVEGVTGLPQGSKPTVAKLHETLDKYSKAKQRQENRAEISRSTMPFALADRAAEAKPELRAGIETLIAQHLPGVEARVKERLTFADLPEKVRERYGIGEDELGQEFHGFSDPADKIIYLSLAAEKPVERAHEEIAHFLDETGLLPDADRAILDDAANKGGWREKLDIDNRYRDFYSRAYDGDRLEQALQGETRAQMLAARVAGDDFGEKANGVLDKLLRFFEAVRNFLHGRGFQTLDDVFQRYAGGEYGRGEEMAGEGRFALAGKKPAREPSPAEQMEAFANQAMRFFISKAGPDINALLKPYARELDAFGRKTTSQDALAFFRSYFTQPSAAQSLAPGFARHRAAFRPDRSCHTRRFHRARQRVRGQHSKRCRQSIRDQRAFGGNRAAARQVRKHPEDLRQDRAPARGAWRTGANRKRPRRSRHARSEGGGRSASRRCDRKCHRPQRHHGRGAQERRRRKREMVSALDPSRHQRGQPSQRRGGLERASCRMAWCPR